MKLETVDCLAISDEPEEIKKPEPGFLKYQDKNYKAELELYLPARSAQPEILKVKGRLPFPPRWGDRLEFLAADKKKSLSLKVIHPKVEKLKKYRKSRLQDILSKLVGDEHQMFLALAEEAGIRGLRQEQLEKFSRLSPAQLQKVASALEKDGLLYILEFSPLLVLTHRSFVFLNEKLLSYIETYHQKRPAELGVPLKKLKDRFNLPRTVLLFSLNWLARQKKIYFNEEIVSLAGFETRLSAEEDQVRQAIEELLRQEKYSSSSLEKLARKFRLHPSRLHTLIDLLLQKKKIFQSQQGFILHADWLESLKNQLADLKRQGKKELTVGEFKKITGLTRKYAIPLLEFLDELGLTRRTGSKREIL
ncbi:MAG: SelB C-terminal domain-containing protein [Candidatus Aminicenantes bacterium]|nr:SelB C-terminal domain-containing protein [Candidatus Aminicenantes bacterium]